MRHIFHTLDLYFGDDQSDNVNRGLDVFDLVKADPAFAARVKTLRIHWAYEEGEMLDLMMSEYSSLFFWKMLSYINPRDFSCGLALLQESS